MTGSPNAAMTLPSVAASAMTGGLSTGFSDHSLGIAIPIAAAARGAEVIEKHLTLDRHAPGPDHSASLEPTEMKAMVEGIREVEQALGTAEKVIQPGEAEVRKVATKSLYASRPIKKGEMFDAANLAVKRPAGGMEPIEYWSLLGTTAGRDYLPDEAVDLG